MLADMSVSPAPSSGSDDDFTAFGWLRGEPGGQPLGDWLAERASELEEFRARGDVACMRSRAQAALAAVSALPAAGSPSVAVGDAIFSLDRPLGASRRRLDRHIGGTAQPVFDVREGAIDWFFPGPDGRHIVVGVSSDGSERSRGVVVEVASGRILPDVLDDVRHACVSWLPDGTGFAYTRYPGDRPYGREVWLHRLGSDDDRLLWGNRPDSTDWPDVELSPDGAQALVHVARGWDSTDVYLLDIVSGMRTGIVEDRAGLTRLHFSESGAVIGVTDIGCERGRVVRVDPRDPDPERWIELVAETDVVLDDCSVRDDGIFLTGERDLTGTVGYAPLPPPGGDALTHPVHPLWAPLPLGDVSIGFPTPGRSTMRSRVVRHLGERTAVFAWSTTVTPPTLMTWTPGAAPVPLCAGPRPATAADVRSREITASDGVGIPVVIAEPEGSAGRPLPTLLHAYGGFGLSASAGFSEVAAAWIVLGGRYAEAGLRGGRERGAGWHAAGSRQHRERVFDDFADVADGLVASGEVERHRLAVWGSSNGGLLMAATIVRRPDLCAAVHAAVPMTDMLGYHRLSIARLWLSDFGDPEDPVDRPWIRAYSPMHNLPPADTALPDILVTTGLHDTRVDPFHAFAFVEALRERQGSSPEARLLLGVDPRGGHGIGKPTDAFVSERADAFALFLTAFQRRADGPRRAAHRSGPGAGD